MQPKHLTTLLATVVLISGIGTRSAVAQEPLVIPAPDVRSQPSDDAAIWHILGLRPGERLNIRSGPGSSFRVIGAVQEGDPVRNLGCRERDGQYWCRIATYDRPRISGWVNGRYVSDEFYEPLPPSSEQDPSIFEQTGFFSCRLGRNQRLFRCPFGLERRGTSAIIEIGLPDGFVRVLSYRAGRYTSLDGATVISTKRDGNAIITVDGIETYVIPDQVILNW
ncbi:SH3 domain-containing protein [Peteryoungia desertarenae]|uniref:SH3 domain-containing protein n=1 Tax=Peteryoungia desertarenae TaxID=1813451 RepID=A0ABX6QJS0_9HYPH|nr:SH3 domain-containing protein [Peteryoungia desertarenae]QLF68350.1 SH3 domain-containing protein [Peteryoungia desertarenae]